MFKLLELICSELHKHLMLELGAFYFYWTISAYFKYLISFYPGFAKYFQHESDDEKTHAQKIIKFLI